MKPRTPREKEVASLLHRIEPLTKAQRRYAQRMFVDCRPQKYHRRSHMKAYQVITVCRGWQVVRTFHVDYLHDQAGNTFLQFFEVAQSWIDSEGHEVIVARSRLQSGWYCDCYSLNSRLEVRRVPSPYASDPYHIVPHLTYGIRHVLPVYKRNGYGPAVYEFESVSTFQRLLNPHHETIAKKRRADLFRLSSHTVDDYWKEIKTIMRHDYHPEDMTLWKDTITMARALGIDSLSPSVCMPADLRREHDRLNDKLDKKRREQSKHLYAESDAAYRRFYGSLLALRIDYDGLHVRPLQDHDEFYEEGKKMHHCVETYYDKRRSLILSVRDDNGNRLATVEVNLRYRSVIQCRGLKNAEPPRFADILALIRRNKNLFTRKAS